MKLRRLVLAHKELAGKLDQLEKKVVGHDDAIRQLLAAIRQLMAPPAAPPQSGRIGFRAPAPKEEKPVSDQGKIGKKSVSDHVRKMN